MLVIPYPFFVSFIQTCDIVYTDTFLVLSPTLLYLAYQIRYAGPQINQQVRRIHQRHHQIEKIGIVLEITGAHQAHRMEIRGEYPGILIDGPVLYDHVLALRNLDHVLEPLVQEVNLEIE